LAKYTFSEQEKTHNWHRIIWKTVEISAG